MVLEPEFRTAEMQGRAFPWRAVTLTAAASS
jgi:hypothetical protein